MHSETLATQKGWPLMRGQLKLADLQAQAETHLMGQAVTVTKEDQLCQKRQSDANKRFYKQDWHHTEVHFMLTGVFLCAGAWASAHVCCCLTPRSSIFMVRQKPPLESATG